LGGVYDVNVIYSDLISQSEHTTKYVQYYSDSLANYKAEHNVTVRSEARDIKKIRAWQGTVVQSMAEF